jgi:NAD(P)-dependent dehydrogenase (short-subunit alcohol dehydrogenase family)
MPRRVLITAAAGGIGLAIARAFAAEGDRVHICDIDAPALGRATAGHDAITGSVCDVSDRVAVAAWVAEAAETMGGIDVLVNNAGVSGPTTAVQDMEPDAWEAVLAVNLTGTFDVTRHAIPHLKRSGDGVILIMSSLAGRFGYENRSPYATAKRGLLGFAETLALELGGDGVRVNAIAPGAVLGERMQAVLRGRQEATGQSMEQLTEEALANQALKRFVDPDDIAALAVFLASDHARSITGQTIAIDGGSKAAQ